jgi:transcriptional regulator with XRE-family HTH domain
MTVKPPQRVEGNRDDLAKSIGNKVKEFRKSMGLTTKRLAEETGLSAPLISRIESGLVIPSVPSLETIANVLKTDIGHFFQKNDAQEFVVSRAGNRTVGITRRGYETELLADGMEDRFMEPVVMILKGKDREKDVPLSTHEGQEFSYVLEGKVEVTLGTKKFTLSKGDAAYWKGSTPHKGISLSRKPAKTLNVNLVPGTRVAILENRVIDVPVPGPKK